MTRLFMKGDPVELIDPWNGSPYGIGTRGIVKYDQTSSDPTEVMYVIFDPDGRVFSKYRRRFRLIEGGLPPTPKHYPD